jgi:hypothetical protein
MCVKSTPVQAATVWLPRSTRDPHVDTVKAPQRHPRAPQDLCERFDRCIPERVVADVELDDL